MHADPSPTDRATVGAFPSNRPRIARTGLCVARRGSACDEAGSPPVSIGRAWETLGAGCTIGTHPLAMAASIGAEMARRPRERGVPTLAEPRAAQSPALWLVRFPGRSARQDTLDDPRFAPLTRAHRIAS